ncbi:MULTISPECIES: LysR family transcriptional regulator [unclassified Novosphingobium]|uniref:LysR family transcriptional regulator n=1 Tax=unclassified Novosphingobium TaxID=2644732 RepID=UPI00146E4A72|nr:MULTISPECIES: LysR family transcriptional regulator [unclassified Novosphingobium]NMN03571.1 DNA-binding transcriptional LysR family regulator [Novosphingobium sp. SG919]NMN86439.1 DNA-binding transcriptional LysR family regulator [Novosphingobium sp. SG916]
MDVGQPSIDQIRIFLAVVDEGTFNGAARRLGRAISVVSYGIANLEAQLGVALFDREGSRKPQLTEAGRAVLASARAVADDVDALMARVRGHNQGLEAELTVVVDVMFPTQSLARLLEDFLLAFPTVDLRLHVEALGAVAAQLLDGQAELAITGAVLVDHPALDRMAIGAVELVPVAAPGHPLAGMAQVTPGLGRQYLQLVLTDRSSLTQGRDFSVLAARTWRLGDLGAKHALLRQGIGWGNMPRHVVADDLASGRLVHLAMAESPTITYPIHAQWRRDSPAGPARAWLLDRLLSGECRSHAAAFHDRSMTLKSRD